MENGTKDRDFEIMPLEEALAKGDALAVFLACTNEGVQPGEARTMSLYSEGLRQFQESEWVREAREAMFEEGAEEDRGRWGNMKEIANKKLERKLVQYEVRLPQSLPISYNGNERLHSRYRNVEKVGKTMAVTPKEAINDYFFRVMNGDARTVYSILRGNGRALGARARKA